MTTLTAQQKEPAYVANFEYTPASQAAPNSAGVTFAVVNVFYQSNLDFKPYLDLPPWFTWPQFANLDTATKQDFSKLLVSKGFTVLGPFDSYDLIPYSDKKAIDLYLVPTFNLSVLLSREGDSVFDYRIKVNGMITLQLKEILTGELMWSKSIPFKKFDFPLSKPGERIIYWPKVMDLVAKEVAKDIEKQYPELMATISRLIDPEEMRIIKKQCQEIKSKKGY
jgi:hypothetical protein